MSLPRGDLRVEIEDRRRSEAAVARIDGLEARPRAVAVAALDGGARVQELRIELRLQAGVALSQLRGVRWRSLVQPLILRQK